MREKRIEIGTFRELNGNDYYPEFESLKLPADKKESVLGYLRNAPHIAESPGMAVDAFTKERLYTAISLQGTISASGAAISPATLKNTTSNCRTNSLNMS